MRTPLRRTPEARSQNIRPVHLIRVAPVATVYDRRPSSGRLDKTSSRKRRMRAVGCRHAGFLCFSKTGGIRMLEEDARGNAAGSLGSARTSRAGDGASPSRTFHYAFVCFEGPFLGSKSVSARRRNQHARRVRYPELLFVALWFLAIQMLDTTSQKPIPERFRG